MTKRICQQRRPRQRRANLQRRTFNERASQLTDRVWQLVESKLGYFCFWLVSHNLATTKRFSRSISLRSSAKSQFPIHFSSSQRRLAPRCHWRRPIPRRTWCCRCRILHTAVRRKSDWSEAMRSFSEDPPWPNEEPMLLSLTWLAQVRVIASEYDVWFVWLSNCCPDLSAECSLFCAYYFLRSRFSDEDVFPLVLLFLKNLVRFVFMSINCFSFFNLLCFQLLVVCYLFIYFFCRSVYRLWSTEELMLKNKLVLP